MTRAEAIALLYHFLPCAGRYASVRNYDFGPERRDNVSMLSPYLRHRLVGEEEVARTVLERFAYSTVEKFLQEVARSTAVDDAVARAKGERLYGDLAVAVQTWMRSEKLDGVIVAYPTVGPWKEVVEELAGHVRVGIFVRPRDRALWPYATAEFFRMREKLPRFFQTLKNDAQERQMRLFS